MPRMQPHDLVFFKTLAMMNKWSAYFLSALEDGEASSTEISRRVSKMTSGEVFFNAGSVNEASMRLCDEGFIDFTEEKRRRVYRLTPAGRVMVTRLYRLSDAYRKMLSDSKAE